MPARTADLAEFRCLGVDERRSSQPLISAIAVTKTHRQAGRPVYALRDLSLSVPAGSLTAVVGPSGSGKTTLLNILGALDAPTAGAVVCGGIDVSGACESDRAHFRARHIGFVFQSFNLLNGLTASQNVELACAITGTARRRRATEVHRLLALVGLTAHAKAPVAELSAGQAQRVAIARALAGDPRLILADEPTGSLDHENAREIFRILRAQTTPGRAVVVATHDHELAARCADQVVRLLDGCVATTE